MKVSVIAVAAALMGLAQAAPAPQDLTDLLTDIPPAETEPVGITSPVLAPDSSAAIQDTISEIEKRGVAADQFVKVFDNWTGSTQTGGYITLKFLDTYSPDICAQKCLDSPSGCIFFNLYVEHNWQGDQIKCALYSMISGQAEATNYGGQVRNGVTTSKSQSSGYRKRDPLEVDGYHYECYGAKSINAPRASNTYMGVSFTPTSAKECAAACEAKTASNERGAAAGSTYRACNFFNYYNVYQDGIPYQNACAFYLVSYSAAYATNEGGQVRNGYTYTIGESCGYTRDVLIGIDGIATKPVPAK